jgi:hypothetical protein
MVFICAEEEANDDREKGEHFRPGVSQYGQSTLPIQHS